MNRSDAANTQADFITPIVGYPKSQLVDCYGYTYIQLIQRSQNFLDLALFARKMPLIGQSCCQAG
jgi:hypothetical protein